MQELIALIEANPGMYTFASSGSGTSHPQYARREGKLIGLGAEPVGSSPDEFSAVVKTGVVKWATVVKQSGAKVELGRRASVSKPRPEGRVAERWRSAVGPATELHLKW